MGQRLFYLVNDKPPSKKTDCLFASICGIFIVHYFLDMFLYLYPFLYLYGFRQECP